MILHSFTPTYLGIPSFSPFLFPKTNNYTYAKNSIVSNQLKITGISSLNIVVAIDQGDCHQAWGPAFNCNEQKCEICVMTSQLKHQHNTYVLKSDIRGMSHRAHVIMPQNSLLLSPLCFFTCNLVFPRIMLCCCWGILSCEVPPPLFVVFFYGYIKRSHCGGRHWREGKSMWQCKI